MHKTGLSHTPVTVFVQDLYNNNFVRSFTVSKPTTESNNNKSATWRPVPTASQSKWSKAACPTWPRTARPSRPGTSPTRTASNRTAHTCPPHRQSQSRSKNPSDSWPPSRALLNHSTSKPQNDRRAGMNVGRLRGDHSSFEHSTVLFSYNLPLRMPVLRTRHHSESVVPRSFVAV